MHSDSASASAPSVIPTADVADTAGVRVGRREVGAGGASLAMHAAAIVVLGLIAAAAEAPSRRNLSLTASLPERREVAPPDVVTAAKRLEPAARSSTSTRAADPRIVVRPTLPQPSSPPSRTTTIASAAPQYRPTRELLEEIAAAPAAPPTANTKRRKPSNPADGGVVAAADARAAIDGVLDGVRQELAGGDLLVVWLLDASLSLVDDRQIIADRLDPFYRQLGDQAGNPHVLLSAAVTYGQSTVELQGITKLGVRLAKATADEVVIDASGLENVMTAVRDCVGRYRRTWKGNMLVVVWTDESGDDILQLEETINLCREQNVGVSVVGPTAVFGSERGFHAYVDRPTGYKFLLPVKRGPDTALPERMPLPFWHESAVAPWSQQGATIDTGGPWYGGAYREGLTSGIGPYALTRLAVQTGGTFTLLDPDGATGPFDFANQRAYLPDYVSAAEYLRQVQYSPLRRAIFDAVQLAFREHERLVAPKLSFVSGRDDYYPFEARDLYVIPTAFRVDLKDELAAETARATDALQLLEQALARFGAAGLEQEYQREKSKRWRAWYDVTLGRLLAAHVRHVEYLHACRLLSENEAYLAPATNHVKFIASAQMLSTDEATRRRATEAERLLRRCVEQNPETPFALLATWELDRPLGLEVRQSVIPKPPPNVGAMTVVPRAPVPTLPRF